MWRSPLTYLYIAIGLGIVWFFASRYYFTPKLEMNLKFLSENDVETDLAGLAGKPLIVHFYASWCGPCMREMPVLANSYADLKAMGFEVICLTDDNPEAIAKEKKRLAGKLPIYKLKESLKDAGIYNIPQTFVFGKNGGLLHHLRGEADWNGTLWRDFLKGLSQR